MNPRLVVTQDFGTSLEMRRWELREARTEHPKTRTSCPMSSHSGSISSHWSWIRGTKKGEILSSTPRMKEADGRTLPVLPLSSGLRLGNGRGGAGWTMNTWGAHPPTALTSPRTLELTPAFSSCRN